MKKKPNKITGRNALKKDSSRPAVKASGSNEAIVVNEYDVYRQTVITVLWAHDEIIPSRLETEVKGRLTMEQRLNFEKHFPRVINDLKQFGLLEEVMARKQVFYRLSQKIDS
jgi:hypothetical protein